MTVAGPGPFRPPQRPAPSGCCGPACGTLGGHFRVDAETFLAAAGYDPEQYPEVVAELWQALPEAVVDTAYAVMRDHGLRPETDPLAPIHGSAGGA